MPSLHIRPRTLLGAACTLLLAACSGGKDKNIAGPESSTGITVQESQAVAVSLFAEVALALNNISFAKPSAARIAARLMPTSSFDSPCQRGGRIVGTITETDDTDDDGTGSVTGTIAVTPRKCVISTGSRMIAVDGDPTLTYTFSLSFRNGELSSDFTWRVSGAVKWDGGRCAVDYTVRINPQGSGSVSGTACGHDVSATV